MDFEGPLVYGGDDRVEAWLRRCGKRHYAVELEMAVLRKAQSEEVYRLFRQAILEAVIAVAEKYGLPCQGNRSPGCLDLLP